jgi:predicted secreted protein
MSFQVGGVNVIDINTVIETQRRFVEKALSTTSGSGTITCNLNDGSVFSHTATGAITINFTNIPTTGATSWTLRIYNGGTARSITFSQTIRWAENTQPPSSTGTDVYTFQIINNVIYGSLSIRGANG